MADARIIPIDGQRPPRRPSTRAQAALDAGAARAGGERERRRRRTTPLLEQAEADQQPGASAPSRGARPAGSDAVPASGADAPAAPRPARGRTARTAATRKAAAPAAARTSARPDRTPLGAEDHRAAQSEADEVGRRLVEQLPADASPSELERRVAEALAFLRRRLTGDYEVDEYGFDPELTDTVLLAVLRPLYRHWFRVQVRGIENIPSQGGALVVANHSGTVAFDALMTQVAVRDEHPAGRHLRMLGADLVFSTPVVGDIARKSGSTLAANTDAERLLADGHLVGVWPESFKGIGKPFSERYKLQRFGRGGFVSAALRTGVPIVPCAIVGAEEIYPILASSKTVARLLGIPYAPITPTWPLLGPLGLVPLPSKWLIEFGEPIPTDEAGEGAADDPMMIFDVTDQVRETIQQTLYSLLMQRRSVFF